jgi:hypothetical protein
VIDMRLSFGGSDELGLAIANRLAIAEYLAYPYKPGPIQLTVSNVRPAIPSSFDRVHVRAFEGQSRC